ncbi:hypothetical protein B7Z28_00620, partial [Candidatus Saccharibacteria bacterium 32-45-3]
AISFAYRITEGYNQTYMENLSETHERLSDDEVEQQLSEVCNFFKEFRQELLSITGNVDFLTKDDGSPVTELDVKVETELKERFAVAYPHTAVFGEETGRYNVDHHHFWLIDPIDGTKSFVEGEPVFTNMAALIENGETRASVIYNPVRDDTYTAIKGTGTYKNGVKVQLDSVNPEPVFLLKKELFTDVRGVLGDVDVRFVNPPSGGGDGFTQILDGIVAARFQMHASGSAHDYAPGALLIYEAGGVILPIKQDSYTFETTSFIATHSDYAELLKGLVPRIRQFEF